MARSGKCRHWIWNKKPFSWEPLTGATLGQSESTSSGLGGRCVVEGGNQFLFSPTRELELWKEKCPKRIMSGVRAKRPFLLTNVKRISHWSSSQRPLCTPGWQLPWFYLFWTRLNWRWKGGRELRKSRLGFHPTQGQYSWKWRLKRLAATASSRSSVFRRQEDTQPQNR